MITTASLLFSGNSIFSFSILLHAKIIYYYYRILFYAVVHILKEDVRVSAPNVFLKLDFRRKHIHNWRPSAIWVVGNDEILNISLSAENTHGTVGSRHDRDTPHIISWGGRVRLRKTWKHARSKDSRYTYPAFPSKNREALRQPPAPTKPPPHLTWTTPPQREDCSPLVRFPPRPWPRRAMRQPSGIALFLQNLADWHGPMSTLDENRFCILSSSNLHCHWDSGAVSLMPSPLSFRLEAKQVLNTLSVFLFVWYTPIFSWRRFNNSQCVSPMLAFFVVYAFFLCQIMTFRISCSYWTLGITLKFNVESDNYNYFVEVLPCPTRRCRRPCAALVRLYNHVEKHIKYGSNPSQVLTDFYSVQCYRLFETFWIATQSLDMFLRERQCQFRAIARTSYKMFREQVYC